MACRSSPPTRYLWHEAHLAATRKELGELRVRLARDRPREGGRRAGPGRRRSRSPAREASEREPGPGFQGVPTKPTADRAFGLHTGCRPGGHATRLLWAGVHPKIVSERLGHTSIGITLDTYSHVMPGMQKEATEKIDAGSRAALAGSRQSTLPAEAFCDI